MSIDGTTMKLTADWAYWIAPVVATKEGEIPVTTVPRLVSRPVLASML